MKKKYKPSSKLLIFLYGISIFLLTHHFLIRPSILSWGAPDSLRTLKLSGDRFCKGPVHTRAVLISATREQIWPWIMQLGQDRGGFYSYQGLENLFGAGMHNVLHIEPALQQQRHMGDTIWLAERDHYNGNGYQILAQIIPTKSFVMVNGDDFKRIIDDNKINGSWGIYLYPADNKRTWLIARSAEGETSIGNRVLRYFFYEVPHFIMEQKMLKTIKSLVEKNSTLNNTTPQTVNAG